jgi:predicted N-acetyltransferase YhbS
MSEQDDALREMAANRGCKLVRSRRRKPGGDFGRYGLKDAKSGKEVLGFGARGLTATAEEIQSFLRGGAAAGWRSSLAAGGGEPGAVVKRKKAPRGAEKPDKPDKRDQPGKAKKGKAAAKAAPKPAERAKPRPRPAPPPKAEIRVARPKDAAAIAALIAELGYEVTEAEVRKRLKRLFKQGEPPLVASLGGEVVGALTWHVTPVLHRPRPVGRITMFAVTAAHRSAGIGALMLEQAEARLREQGCGLVEVTSNMKRMRAHGFYERHGYARTSYRFARQLQE